MSLSDGAYRILTALDADYCLDLTGAVATAAANVELWARNDSNAQHVLVETSGGTTTFRFACSNQRMDVKGAVAADGTNIIQWPDTNSGAQDFVLTEDAVNTMAVNGTAQSTYEIASNLDTGYVADAAYAIAGNGTNVLLWSQSADPAPLNQRWCFVKDSYYEKSLPVPASLGLSDAQDGEGRTQLSLDASASMYATWLCDSTEYQVRYRKRSRNIGSNVWGDWGNWTSPAGSTSDEGWGDAWDGNTTTTAGRGSTSAITIANPLTASSDKDEYQFEARAWTDDTVATYWTGAHGASATANISVAYLPTLVIDSFDFTPYGIVIGYTSDFQRAGNRLKVSDLYIGSDLLCEGYEWDNLPYTGIVTIPMSELLFVPDDQDTVDFSAELQTIDTSASYSMSETLSYGTGQGLSFSITQTASGDDVKVTFSASYQSRELYLVYAHDGRKRCEKVEERTGGTWTVHPPFNTSYKLLAAAENSSNSWAVIAEDGLLVQSDAFVWDFSGHAARLAVSTDSTSMMARAYTKNATSYKLNGMDYDSIAYGRADTNAISASGYISRSGYASSTIEDFELLLDYGYALFRDPYGGRYHVAVTGMSDSGYVGEWLALKVTQQERS